MMIWVKAGSALMLLTVALGAFAAHALRPKLSEYSFDIFRTGVLYSFLHALALFVVAWMGTRSPDVKIHIAGIFFVAGIVLFSGSLYILSLTNIKGFGFLTPLGGIAFLAGWLLLLICEIN